MGTRRLAIEPGPDLGSGKHPMWMPVGTHTSARGGESSPPPTIRPVRPMLSHDLQLAYHLGMVRADHLVRAFLVDLDLELAFLPRVDRDVGREVLTGSVLRLNDQVVDGGALVGGLELVLLARLDGHGGGIVQVVLHDDLDLATRRRLSGR